MCFSILWKLHANIKLHLPKKMFHQIQKFPTLYLQANIHTLQKILTCFCKPRRQACPLMMEEFLRNQSVPTVTLCLYTSNPTCRTYLCCLLNGVLQTSRAPGPHTPHSCPTSKEARHPQCWFFSIFQFPCCRSIILL